MNHITSLRGVERWTCRESKPHLARQACVESLIRDHGEAAYSYAYRLARRREAAKDLVQEALLKTITKPPRCGKSKSLRQWLFTVIHNRFVDCTRSCPNRNASLDWLHPTGVAYAELVIGEPSPLDQLVRMERIALTRMAFGRLKNGFRQPLLLRDVEGHSYNRVAKLLGLPITTVRSRIHRARRALKQNIEALGVQA